MKRFLSLIVVITAVITLTLSAFAAVRIGDTNGDGELNNKDVVILFRFVSGMNAECVEEASDVNGDRAVNNKDVVVLFRLLNKIQTVTETKDPNELPVIYY